MLARPNMGDLMSFKLPLDQNNNNYICTCTYLIFVHAVCVCTTCTCAYTHFQKMEEVFKTPFDDHHFRMCLTFVVGLTHLLLI